MAHERTLCGGLFVSAVYGLDSMEIEGSFLGRKSGDAAETPDDFCRFGIAIESTCHTRHGWRNWNQLPQYDGGERWAFGLAAVSVSWIWFIGLATAGRLVGRMDSEGKFGTVLNKISALIILGLAMYMAINFITSM